MTTFYKKDDFRKDLNEIIRSSTDTYSLYKKLELYEEISRDKNRLLDTGDRELLLGLRVYLKRYLDDNDD